MKKVLRKLGLALGFFTLLLVNLLFITKLSRDISLANKQKQILSQLPDFPANLNRQSGFPPAPLVLGAMTTDVKLGDSRAANLKEFFRRYHSPLYDYADLIVQISDKYVFDYRLLPAIAMQESNACLKVPANSHNCWGYGIYGDKVTNFDSYEEAIATVAYGIKHNYIDKGLITPETVMAKYTPGSTGSWASAVTYFFQTLE